MLNTFPTPTTNTSVNGYKKKEVKAMIFSLITNYMYFRSPGTSPDRKLGFYENGADSIEVRIEAKTEGKWQEIGVLQEKDVWLEGESITERMQRFIESRRLGTSMQFKPDIQFSDINLERKKDLLCRCHDGAYGLMIQNDIGKDPRFEAISRIAFFIPTQQLAEFVIDPSSISSYYYTHGIRDPMNRKLDFCQQDDQSIVVGVSARLETGCESVCVIPEDQIYVEAESTTEKVKRCAEDKRLGKSISFLPDIKFSELNLEKKKGLISQLQPEGPYRIAITNIFPEGSRFEQVERIRFYNPY